MTPAQRDATKRNHNILRLRGTYSLFVQLGSEEGKRVVDQLLARLGAEPEGVRRHKMIYGKEPSS